MWATHLFEAADEVVVGLGSREAEGGLRPSEEDGAGGQDREAAGGHPPFVVEPVHSQGDLQQRQKKRRR